LPKTGNHQEHALAVFNRNAHKVMKDVISYACIQVNNQYYKEVLHQKISKKLGSSAIYLTEEQYCQVKNPKSFDIQHLRLVVTQWFHSNPLPLQYRAIFLCNTCCRYDIFNRIIDSREVSAQKSTQSSQSSGSSFVPRCSKE
jgi:hypothetical protein